MFKNLSFALTVSVLLSLLTGLGYSADQPSPAELKMREMLRNTMLQLRAAETEKINLETAQAELQKENDGLKKKSAALTKQLAEDKDASDKAIASLKEQLATRGNELADLSVAHSKLQAAFREKTAVAESTEKERSRLATELMLSQRTAVDHETKNRALFKLGKEILSRYEKFGLGDAITAREPFVGITRTKFENYIQDYGDKLAEQKVTPAPAAR
jgi:hypothetical protein